MDEPERAKKDIDKLAKIINEFKKHQLHEKYPQVIRWVENYLYDARHFFKNKDYYSAFGAANYAFGIIDGILIIEGKKNEAISERQEA